MRKSIYAIIDVLKALLDINCHTIQLHNCHVSARPVDTTKREREIEEKLRKTDINNEKPKTSNHPQHKNESNNQRSRDRPETEEKEKKVRSPPPPKEVEEAKPPVS